MAKLNWIGEEAVIGRRKRARSQLLKCAAKVFAAMDWPSIDVAFRP